MEIRAAAIILSLVGAAAVALAWVAVRTKVATVWGAMGLVLGLLGVISLASERVRFVDELAPVPAAVVGLVAGLLLYAATWAFMSVAGRWNRLVRHTDDLYEQRHGVTLARAVAIATLIVVPGEELFWRGIVQSVAGAEVGAVAGALVAWIAYVLANAASGSVPVMLGVAVGGVVWGGLAVWPGGVLAATVCHMVWTGLMILRRPG